MKNISEISADLDNLESEIESAERDLVAAKTKHEVLQERGQQHGVNNTKEAKKLIDENQKEMIKLEKKIVDGYEKLKSEYEW